MNPPSKIRPRPRDYLLSLAMQLSKLMDDQELEIDDLEQAIKLIKQYMLNLY